jgi:hypothetical protein
LEPDPEVFGRNQHPRNRAALRDFLTPEATKSQYLYGVQNEALVAPEAYQFDSALLARPGNDEIQLDLFLDYAGNIALPEVPGILPHESAAAARGLGQERPVLSAVRAEAFKRDNPNAEVQLSRD